MSVASFVDAHAFLAKKNDGEKWNIIPIGVRGFKKNLHFEKWLKIDTCIDARGN